MAKHEKQYEVIRGEGAPIKAWIRGVPVEDAAREQLLNLIEGMLLAEERTAGKKVYIGVKGRVAYGALRAPGDLTRTGAAVSERFLYGFYVTPAAPASGPAPAPSSAPTDAPAAAPTAVPAG